MFAGERPAPDPRRWVFRRRVSKVERKAGKSTTQIRRGEHAQELYHLLDANNSAEHWKHPKILADGQKRVVACGIWVVLKVDGEFLIGHFPFTQQGMARGGRSLVGLGPRGVIGGTNLCSVSRFVA